MAIVEAIVLLVAVSKVAVLEVVVAIVTTTSNAVVIVASASLTVVDIKAAPVLEGVNGKVEVFLVVVRLLATVLEDIVGQDDWTRRG